MDSGRILAEGAPDELIRKHIKRNVVELRLYEEELEKVLKNLQGFEFDYEVSGDTLFLYSDDRESLIKGVTGVGNGYFIQRHATLEDVFLKLTGRELKE